MALFRLPPFQEHSEQRSFNVRFDIKINYAVFLGGDLCSLRRKFRSLIDHSNTSTFKYIVHF